MQRYSEAHTRGVPGLGFRDERRQEVADGNQAAGGIQGETWLTVGVLAFGVLLIYADRTTLYPMLKVIGEHFHLSGTATEAIASTCFFLYVTMQVTAGALGDRLGLKQALAAFFALGGLVSWACRREVTRPWCCSWGCTGSAWGPSTRPLTASISAGCRRSGGAWPRRWSTPGPVGTALGLAFSGPLYLWSGNFRLPLLVLAVPTLVALVLFWHGLPEVKGNAPGGAGEGAGFSFGQNLRDRDLWARRKS